MTADEILLDEHVGRVFERVLREQGFSVAQASDKFGERTVDSDLLHWCREHDHVLITNNAKDFRVLHESESHAGILLFFEQMLPDEDPEGLARTVDEVFAQYGADGLENQLVDVEAWYDWLHD